MVSGEIQTISSFSAHADYEEMIRYLKCQDAGKLKKLFLVHGEYEVQQEFKSKLEKVGFKNIEIPEENSVVTLS